MEFTDGSNPQGVFHWVHKEMQTSKKNVKYTIPQLLLSIIAKIKVLGQTLVLNQDQILVNLSFSQLALKLSPKGKVIQGQQRAPLSPLSHQSPCGGGRTKPRSY